MEGAKILEQKANLHEAELLSSHNHEIQKKEDEKKIALGIYADKLLDCSQEKIEIAASEQNSLTLLPGVE